MATKARQQYFADEDSLQKIRREFSIADDIQQKIDSIEPGAQVNKIETVKVNGTALVPDANKAVNVEVPEVIDNLYTVDSDNALSAKQGKLLYDYIQNIASRGRFLSNWNSATGLPMTNPSESPYPYKSGDYFVVSNVAASGGTNYRPDGSSYTIGQASTVVETNSVDVSDFYFYDGTNWLLLKNSGRSIAVDSSLSTTSTNPVENRIITNALNNKQDVLTAGNHIDITNNVISAEGFQEELTAGENITIGDECIAESDMKGPCPKGFHVPLTTEWEGLNTIITSLSLTTGDGWRINLHMPFAGRRNNSDASLNNQGAYGYYWASSPDSANDYARSLTLDLSSVGPRSVSNRARGFSVRCFKNEYVTPDSNWTVIQGTLGSAGIFWNQSEGLISITDGSTGYTIMDKNLGATAVYNDGDTLTQANMGNMYQWGNNYGFPSTGAISNTSSNQVDASGYGPTNPYSNSTFITNQHWSSVQNDNLRGGVSQGTHQECIPNVISATDTKYTAGTGISIDANNVISSTATSAQWGNITGTLSNQTDLQSALDSKVNLGMNKVFDNTVVEIGKWEHEPGGDSSGHHIELDPSGEVSTYNLTQAGHNEATLGSGTLELLNNTVLDGNKTATFDHEKIVADDGTNTETYNFFGNNRIAKLSDLDSGVNTKTFFLNREATKADKIATLQEVYDWIKDGTRNAIIEAIDEEAGNLYPDRTFILSDWWDSEASGNPITFLFQNGFVHDNFTQETLSFTVLNDVVTSYTHNQQRKIAVAGDGINIANNRISNTLPGPTIAATAPTGTEGALWYDTTNDVLMAHDGTAWKEAGTQMKVLSYGHSTWQDFINAYNENAIVYCKASSNSNPGSGNQGRMAFMAFVSINNTTGLPTEVEFQYYRSRSDHNSAANQLDQVFVYKLTSAGAWTVTERNTGAKAVAGTGISLGRGSGNMTISADTTVLATKTDLSNKQDTLTAGSNIQINNNVISATDTTYNAGTGISIGNITKNGRQGPSPDGFHVPAITEWQGLKTIMDGLSLTTGDNWRINLHMPFAGFRDYVDGVVYGQVLYAYYWSSSPYSDYPDYPRSLQLNSSNVNANFDDCSYAFGLSVRSFKDSYITPDSTWTVIQGTLGSAGIFWNQSEGLISITDGSTGYTIMDKNLGATTVYNDGDTLTQANMGNMYQWGNNYGFPSTGTITNTSSTQVDASAYGPNTANGYYSSDTFITGSSNWSSVRNDDLWGDTTGTYTQENVISNTGVLSVNGQTGDVTIPTAEESNTKTFYISSASDLTNAQAAVDWYLAGGNPIVVYGTGNEKKTFVLNYIYNDTSFIFTTASNKTNDTSTSTIYFYRLRLSVSSGTVTNIYYENYSPKYLDTSYNYGTPYTPQYDGSPATKKYVDDHGVPSGGNNGDVLTNVSGTPTWSAPSGGDVMVSSQPNNILTSGMKIWAGEETDYSNLGTYDTNTVYLTIPDGSVQAIDNNEDLPNDAD